MLVVVRVEYLNINEKSCRSLQKKKKKSFTKALFCHF